MTFSPTVRCTAIQVRSRNAVLHGHSLALSTVIIESGPHQVIALLPVLASELDWSRKTAVCSTCKDFPTLRIPTIRKDIDQHEPARPRAPGDTLQNRRRLDGLYYRPIRREDYFDLRAGSGRWSLSEIEALIDLNVLMQVWIGHLQPDCIAAGQLWLDHGAQPAGSIIHAPIEGNVSKVAVTDRVGISRIAGRILIAEGVLVSDLPLAERRMEIVPEDRVVSKDVALRRKAPVEIGNGGLHVWPKHSSVGFLGISMPTQHDSQRPYGSAARKRKKPAGCSANQPEQSFHRDGGQK